MSPRETFGSRLGALATMIGVAVGLGNVWRFPYMVGRFGGAAFVLLYVAIAALVGVPALMAEWSLGRHTRRGTLGAFEVAGTPGGRALGWLLGVVVLAAVAYYNNAIGWVIYHALGQIAVPLGDHLDASRILPPDTGFSPTSLGLQVLMTALVLGAEAAVILAGVRGGIERASRWIMPVLFGSLLLLIVRSLTLPGSGAGVRWLFAFHPRDVTASVTLAALGQVVFSLALGGTFMLTYGSYLADEAGLRADAAITVAGDTAAGLLAGLAIFPAVFAFGLEPGSGPGLLFATLPQVFARIPGGWIFGTLFFGSLSGAALLSGIAAYEVLVVGLADTLGWARRRAVWVIGLAALVLALPPMINLEVFVPWDLTFGSGGQTFGAILAVITVGWCMRRGDLLRQLGGDDPTALDRVLAWWLRWVIPAAVLAASAWWLLTDVLGAVRGV
ncbi:MAG: sodium-dependent transporter [Gemmatimonadetes bacterium]|nr:sodium-dependent transporter [Gemmatimonadota bacterium]